jgi:hypothetical protein
MRMLRSAALCIGVCLLGAASTMWAQAPCASLSCIGDSNSIPSANTPNNRRMPNTVPPPPVIGNTDSVTDGRLERDQARSRNTERQKQLEADTQKLVALANELKADVEKSNKDTLSLDVVRKADEIEKLAKSVRDKMKGS